MFTFFYPDLNSLPYSGCGLVLTYLYVLRFNSHEGKYFSEVRQLVFKLLGEDILLHLTPYVTLTSVDENESKNLQSDKWILFWA